MKNAASSNVNAIECYSTNLVLSGTGSGNKCVRSFSTVFSPVSEAYQDIDHWSTAIILLDSNDPFP